MSYEHDVFLSYNRKFPSEEWVEKVFYPFFVPYLADALNKDVFVFKDTEEITSGSSWPNHLKHALTHSKCMVSIFCPAYFRSQWCMKEFSAMYFRQTQPGYLTINNPNGLIVPLNIFDGEHFPPYVQELQIMDCKAYYRVGDGFKLTPAYIEFQALLQNWVYDVAKAVNNAPAWDPAWIEDKWLEPPVKKSPANRIKKTRKPIL